MSATTKLFRVYEPARQGQDQAREIEAGDIMEAARLFIADLPDADLSTEVAVICDNGMESLFGYRQTVPQEHLDD